MSASAMQGVHKNCHLTVTAAVNSAAFVILRQAYKRWQITWCIIIVFVMAALRSRCGHYIFALWFLYFFLLSFFPRLISAVGDWMSTILPHMVWPLCDLECMSEMCCTQLAENTGRKKSPSRHHRTNLSGHIFATKTCIDNRKKTC